MSFLTEYFEEYRQHPIRRTLPCRPENRWAKLEGKWHDPKLGTNDNEMSQEKLQQFIKDTMKSLRGQSTYFNDYCSHLDQSFKTRPFVPRPKKKRPCKEEEKKAEEEVPEEPIPKLAMKDTELMKVAHELYDPDREKKTLEPLVTTPRIYGYTRKSLYHTGLSEYQHSIARLAYELVRDDRIPKYYAHNGSRPRWGSPPEETRQPHLDIIPLDGESLF